MKKILALTLSAVMSFACFAQEQNDLKQPEPNKFIAVKGLIDSSKIYTSVEQFPEFEGGQKGLSSFLGNNIRYPADARAREIQGRVVVKFVVCTDGSLCDETIVHSVDSSIDNEVLRVVKSMPKWKPGMQNGQPVKTFYLLPVTFKLQGQEKDTLPDSRDYLLPKPPVPPVAAPVEKVYTSVEHIPEFQGGMKGLVDYLSKNLKYPSAAKAQNIHGRVVVQFLVEKDGSLSNIQVKRSIGGGCDEEAKRVIQAMPKWIPGSQNGHNVTVMYVLPLLFEPPK